MRFGRPTLGEYIIEKQKDFKHSTGELTRLLSAIRLASKIVHREVNKAGLANIIGSVGSENIQGEVQQKLDVFANKIFIDALANREVVCGIASEENDNFIAINPEKDSDQSKYIVLIDPLDGSSNIDVNVSVGTIFSIFHRITPKGNPVQSKDFLQRGVDQVAAGYVLYGSSTMIVFTTGNGVSGFTFDSSLGVFYLSHPNIRILEEGSIYSINEGNYVHFPKGIKQYIKYCQEEKENRPYTSRYIGSLVADFHRNMLKGGVYIYPTTTRSPNGKLRLLYECNPIAMLAEQAGGKASDGTRRIMEIQPATIHQRTPFVCGSIKMVEKVEDFIRENN